MNKIVNSSVKPMVDMEHWGVVDHWDFPDDGYGDCEDYQLLKRGSSPRWASRVARCG